MTLDRSGGAQYTKPPQGRKGILALTLEQLQLSGVRYIGDKKENEQMTGKMRQERCLTSGSRPNDCWKVSGGLLAFPGANCLC